MIGLNAPLSERARWLWSTTRPESGWHFEDARFLAVRTEVDRAAVRKVVPAGLRVGPSPRATLFVAQFPESRAVGPGYAEAGIFLHVLRGGREALHCPWIIVTDDVALILGRDLLGYPKKMGDVKVSFTEQGVEAHVSRRGAPLIDLTATIGRVDPEPPPMEGLPTYNVIGTVGASVQRLVKFEPTEEIIESRHAKVELAIHPAECDPIAELGFGRVVGAHFYRVKLGGSRFPVPVLPVGPRFWVHNWSLRCR
jgi:acetoacetate decarboxylase